MVVDLVKTLKEVLSKDDRLVSSDGDLLKNKVVELGWKLDEKLVESLHKNNELKQHFFKKIDGALLFDQNKFMKFVDNKEFLPDSFTSFKNKIGLTKDESFLSKSGEVVLSWAYKDCILEGGMTKEDQKRDEVFFNEILAPSQIDRLKDAKVLTNFKKYDKKGEHKVTEIKPKDNLIIKGNNLLALYTIKKKFAGKIKLIYIDPPYNTGSDSFHYNDSFNHSTWLTFMKNRLEVARELLSDDGAIYISIDHHENHTLKILLDEIFGKENFVQDIIVKTTTPTGFKVINPGPVKVTEYVLVYAKKKPLYLQTENRLFVEDIDAEPYSNFITNREESYDKWKITNIKNVALNKLGVKNESELFDKYGKDISKKIVEEKVREVANEFPDAVFNTLKPHNPGSELKKMVEKSIKNKGNFFQYNNYYLLNGRLLAFYSTKMKEIDGKKTTGQHLTNLWTDISWHSLHTEGHVMLSNAKKPEKLLKRIIELCTKEGDIVLDYHLGSGTTSAVAHKMGRQYIGIEQLNYEENGSVTRLKNVINGDTSGISKDVDWKGGGDFVYCELMQWNDVFREKIISAKTSKELIKIWEEMKERAFLSYKVDIKKFDETKKEFEELSIENQKKFLIECLDMNQVYVNLSEIEDKVYGVSKEDKELNKKFHGGL